MAKPSLKSPLSFRGKRSRQGFSLVELLVSVAILVIILGVIFAMTSQTARVYKSTGGQMESFRAARNAFETITRNLSLATLNNYYDYVDATGKTRAQVIKANVTADINAFNPTTYGRVSDLHFVSGWYNVSSGLYSKQVTHSIFFQAPLGFTTTATLSSMENLLSACGYYIEYKEDADSPTFITSPKIYRYRLMEFIQPSEDLSVYTKTDTTWFTIPLGATTPPVHQIAPNIIALLILPRSSSADSGALTTNDPIGKEITNFQYNTRTNTAVTIHNQLPPIVEVIMVAIDEASAVRITPNTSAPPTVIQTAITTNTRFQSVAKLETDLTDLQIDLSAKHITYRVFRTLVPLRNSKWSSN